MDPPRAAVLGRRLATQLLVEPAAPRAVDVVARLTCVQAQEPAHAFWSLGMRTADTTYASVQGEFDAGAFVRTHILRPTWHFVAAADLRWILAATSPRVEQRNAGMYRKLGLDESARGRATEIMVAALAGGHYLTRPELGHRLESAGLSATGQRLAYLVMHAELAGIVCSGPMRGAQHTYALLAERIPPAPSGAGVAELVRRFFLGHGPASLADFSRWSSLTLRTAQAGLDQVQDQLRRDEVEGVELWSDADAAPAAQAIQASVAGRAWLLPLYDELTLSYPQLNFEVAVGHPHPSGADRFVGSVIDGVHDVGLWKRTVSGRRVGVSTWLAPGLPPTARAAVDRERSRLAGFLGRTLIEAESF